MRPMRILLAMALLLLVGCGDVLSQSRSVCVSGYNEYERGIHEFWLDNEGKAGCHGNPPGREDPDDFGGGGKFTCGCRVTADKQVSLFWQFRRSRAEYEAGIEPEQRTVQVTIPQPESRTSEYLRVYFMKDGSAALQWVDDMGAPTLSPSQGGRQDE